MPILTKPCKGKVSEETQQLIQAQGDRADWGVYPCEVCGHSVGVVVTNGVWVLERHWPSIVYAPRKPTVSRYAQKIMTPTKLRTSS